MTRHGGCLVIYWDSQDIRILTGALPLAERWAAGTKSISMNENIRWAASASYSAGVSLGLHKRCFTARMPCQKQSCCFASGHVAAMALISDQSLSVSVNSGSTPSALSCPRKRSRMACFAPGAASLVVRMKRNASGMPAPLASATAANSSKLPPLVFPSTD